MENSPQHIVVLGPGGVGGLIAALASRAGHRVTCLASESTVDVLRRDGITVGSAQFGDFTAPVEADTALREPAGLVFVTVKATSLEAALDRLDPDAIGGALLRAGERHGIDTPVIRDVMTRLQPQQSS